MAATSVLVADYARGGRTATTAPMSLMDGMLVHAVRVTSSRPIAMGGSSWVAGRDMVLLTTAKAPTPMLAVKGVPNRVGV